MGFLSCAPSLWENLTGHRAWRRGRAEAGRRGQQSSAAQLCDRAAAAGPIASACVLAPECLVIFSGDSQSVGVESLKVCVHS